jgi:hypothetical protein
LLSFSYYFLEGIGFPKVSAVWTFALIMAIWLIASPFVARRYR